MKSFKSTALHTLELAIILVFIWAMTQLFPGAIPSEKVQVVLFLILAALTKLIRVSDSVPVKDYVNK